MSEVRAGFDPEYSPPPRMPFSPAPSTPPPQPARGASSSAPHAPMGPPACAPPSSAIRTYESVSFAAPPFAGHEPCRRNTHAHAPGRDGLACALWAWHEARRRRAAGIDVALCLASDVVDDWAAAHALQLIASAAGRGAHARNGSPPRRMQKSTEARSLPSVHRCFKKSYLIFACIREVRVTKPN